MLKVMVVGSGAREHALVWKIAQNRKVEKIFIAPGNAGTTILAENLAIHPDDIESLATVAQDKMIDLVIVGPEQPLAHGIVDYFENLGIPVFGPTKAASQIESSKIFARELMRQSEIPCPKGVAFSSYDEANSYLIRQNPPFVVKADGLAAGKGIIITNSLSEASQALKKMMEGKAFGSAGNKVIIDDYISGREVSLLAFTDGKSISTMIPVCDYKKAYDGDHGPNTGGMGCYSRPDFFSRQMVNKATQTVLLPAIKAMAQRGTPYKGVLYAGLMVTDEGDIFVLEYNCRFGDPETQVLLPLLKTDIVDICLAVVQNRLDEIKIEWSSNACVGTVMSSEGYPGSYETGYPISGLDNIDKNALAFQAGTKLGNEGKIYTNSGRVLTLACTGRNVAEARARVYHNLQNIHFKGSYYRKDIALRKGD